MYCSQVCTKASITPFASCLLSRLFNTSGSKIANCGYEKGEWKNLFSFVSDFVITAPVFDSLPVAARVKTTPILGALVGVNFPSSKSHPSPS